MLEAVFEAIPDVFFLMEEDGTIIDYHGGDNKEPCVSAKEYLGKSITDLFPDNVARKFKIYNAKAINQGGCRVLNMS
ncbi:MAG: hypothetical protein ACI8R9_002457 [Paraglaciecola sp.]|jgi:hypothetical protein